MFCSRETPVHCRVGVRGLLGSAPTWIVHRARQDAMCSGGPFSAANSLADILLVIGDFPGRISHRRNV